MVVYEGWKVYHEILIDSFPCLYSFTIIQDNQKWKVVTKNKTDNPRFVDEEISSLVPDENYHDYNTPNTSRVDETLFTRSNIDPTIKTKSKTR